MNLPGFCTACSIPKDGHCLGPRSGGGGASLMSRYTPLSFIVAVAIPGLITVWRLGRRNG